MNDVCIKIFVIIVLLFLMYWMFFQNVLNDDEQTYTEQFEAKNENMTNDKDTINDDDKIIWAYWENRDDYIPTHIKLCFDTFDKHLKPKYKVIILDQNTIKKYLPDVRSDLDDLLIAQKVDYYRIALLYKYGGIWIDADTIIMRDLDDVFDKLKTYDFVGFGCTQHTCFNGKDQPSNGVLASQKNSKLMKLCLDKLNKKLDNRNKFQQLDYFDLGKYIIWEALYELKQTGYDYYHYPSEYDGTRDKNGIWLDTNRHFSEDEIALIDENKLFFVFLTNSGINEYQPWVKNAKRDDILFGKYWVSKMFRKSLEND